MNTGQGVKDDSGIFEPQSAAAGWSRGGNFKHVTAFLRLCVRLRVFFFLEKSFNPHSTDILITKTDTYQKYKIE